MVNLRRPLLRAGLYPTDDLEAARCDAIMDCTTDFYVNLAPSLREEDNAKKVSRRWLDRTPENKRGSLFCYFRSGVYNRADCRAGCVSATQGVKLVVTLSTTLLCATTLPPVCGLWIGERARLLSYTCCTLSMSPDGDTVTVSRTIDHLTVFVLNIRSIFAAIILLDLRFM